MQRKEIWNHWRCPVDQVTWPRQQEWQKVWKEMRPNLKHIIYHHCFIHQTQNKTCMLPVGISGTDTLHTVLKITIYHMLMVIPSCLFPHLCISYQASRQRCWQISFPSFISFTSLMLSSSSLLCKCLIYVLLIWKGF